MYGFERRDILCKRECLGAIFVTQWSSQASGREHLASLGPDVGQNGRGPVLPDFEFSPVTVEFTIAGYPLAQSVTDADLGTVTVVESGW